MNLLYLGKYNQRFTDMIKAIPPHTKTVVELCFGDIKVASYCKTKGIEWIGYDLNPAFVSYANQQGFQGIRCDLTKFEDFKKSDAYLIQGSLYHFHQMLELFLKRVFKSTDLIIISEPVRNMTQWPWPFSTLAAHMTKVAKNKSEAFRYNETTLLSELTRLSKTLLFSIDVISKGKDMILILKKLNHDKS